jgi:phage gp36-like protein
MQSLVKQPSETLKRQLQIAGAGAIVRIEQISAEARGLVPGAADLGVAGELVAGMLFVTLSGGSDGELYLVTAVIEDSAGEIREAELEVRLLDGRWTMPDGGAGYLSIAEFVDQVGLEEVVRLTDTQGDGRIDRDFLVSKLRAAQAIADVHVAARYQVPLSAAPEALKLAIGDVARARLYRDGVPDNVDAAAKAAVRLLERIGAGTLPLPAAEPLDQAPSSSPVMVSPGRRQYPDHLRDY